MSIPCHIISNLKEVFRGYKDVCRSPLRHLLKSNATPPSDSEVIAIRALITEAEACIERLHRPFPVCDRASKVIESKLLQIIKAYRALLSPVRYLPSEILQEIFLHYADNRGPNVGIASMPWRLGHISRRWRKIALSFPPLWDNIPKIDITIGKTNQSYVRALICLLQRSGTSPTLKFDIGFHFLGSLKKVHKTPIINEILLHSERIERLHIEVNKVTMPLFQGFKGRLLNLRILRVLYHMPRPVRDPNLDVFETAPALRQVAMEGLYHGISSDRVVLPWSHITHFEDRIPTKRVGQLVPLPSLHSLTNLDIFKFSHCHHFDDESAVRSPYRPTTLPNLRTLKLLIDKSEYKDVDLFLECLTIPAVEVMKIFYVAPLIHHLVSMFSGSRGPSRLQKLAFRTARLGLQTGELSALLKLTPHLVELDVDVPPADDLLKLIYGEGEVMLVPMLQVLYMHITSGTQTEHFNTLAQARCELGSREVSEDATMPSLGPGTRICTTLHTLRLVFDSPENRDKSQKILNNWSSSFTREESEAIDMIRHDCFYIRSKLFVENSLKLACNERCLITNKVLHVSSWEYSSGRLHVEFSH